MSPVGDLLWNGILMVNLHYGLKYEYKWLVLLKCVAILILIVSGGETRMRVDNLHLFHPVLKVEFLTCFSS